ncbi:MAG: hypothetical protein J6R18_01845 [Kiritimatiellae bacterium]|nr:hypothetical protein [Kiritimatiellia bacterium]
MKNKFITTVAAVCCAATLFAAGDYSSWIWQTKNDTNDNPSASAGYSFSGSAFWSDGKDPDPGKSYYVPEGIHHFAPNKGAGPFTFDGDMLAVSGVFHLKTGSGKKVSYKNLILDDGALFMQDSTGEVTGQVTVVSSRQNPTIMRVNFEYASNSTVSFIILADMYSNSDGCVRFENLKIKKCNRWFRGDNSGYYGTFLLADPYAIYDSNDFVDFPGTLAFAKSCQLTIPEGFPGTVASTEGYSLDITSNPSENFEAFNGGALSYTESRKIRDLKLSGNSLLKVPFSATSATPLIVTNSFAVSDSVTIELDGFSSVAFTNGTKDVSIIKLEGLAADNAPDVSSLSLKTLDCGLPRGVTFTWKEEDDGSKILILNWKPVVMAKQALTGNQINDPNYAQYWSDGQCPHSGCDYLIEGFASYTFSCPNDLSFDGDALIFNNQSLYLNNGENINVSDLWLNGFSTTVYGKSRNFNGGLTIKQDGATFALYQTKFIRFYGDIKGEGDISITGSTNNSQKEPYGTVVFAKGNENFGGRIILTIPMNAAHSSGRPATPDPENGIITRCLLQNGNGLGGPYTKDGNSYSAITIKNYSKLYTDRSISITEPTRGILIDNGALIEVPTNESFTINSPITYNGELRKLSGGTLVLGSRALFVDGKPDTEPVFGKNILSVRDGAIKPTIPEATDGLAIEFRDDSSLVLPVNEKGLLSVRDGSSITVNSSSGKVPVSFDLTGFDVSQTTFSIPVATVSSDNSDALAAKFAPQPRVGKNVFVEMVVVVNEDGTATIKAKYAFKALSITIR